MRVVYVGVFRDGTGWAQAAIDYVLSLDAAGVDVVPRCLKLNGSKPELPPRLLELEAKSSQGCDVVIQHVLPHHTDVNGRFGANIALFASETSDFRKTSWADRLNLMDNVWVINRQMVEAAHASGVKKPIAVIPHATDVEKFQKSYPTLSLLKPYKNNFLFYWAGEFVRRKNLQGLLQAFHSEFDPSEPVKLVIKTNKSGMSPQEVHQHAKAFCSKIKHGLKLHSSERHYNEEIIITDRLAEEEMGQLHSSCDCFVMPSYGEAWCIPGFDAMGFGKTPIVSTNTGFLDYIDDSVGWLIPCQPAPVFGVDDTFSELYTGHEHWQVPNIMELRRAMREAFENRSLREQKALEGMGRIYDFSYEKIGGKMKEELLGIL